MTKPQKSEQQIADMLVAELRQRLPDETMNVAGFMPWIFWQEPETPNGANWGARYNTPTPASPRFHAAWLEALKAVCAAVDLTLPPR
jgi:hypothetical protein